MKIMNRRYLHVVWAASVAAVALAVGIASGQSWDDPWEPGSECEQYCPCLKGCPCPAVQDSCLADACPSDDATEEVAVESGQPVAHDVDNTDLRVADAPSNEPMSEDSDYWYDSETKQYYAHQFAERVDDSVEVRSWDAEPTAESDATESMVMPDGVTDSVALEAESSIETAVADGSENTSLGDPYDFEYDHTRNHPLEVCGGAHGTPAVAEDIDAQADMAVAQDAAPTSEVVASESPSDADEMAEGRQYVPDEPSVEDMADAEVQVVPGEESTDAVAEPADDALTIEQLWGIQPEAPSATPDQKTAANQDSARAEGLLSVARVLERASELLHGLSQHLQAMAEQELAQNPGATLQR
jgi:hypothetical protein